MPKKYVPLAAQSLDDPVPYSLPANTTIGTAEYNYICNLKKKIGKEISNCDQVLESEF